MRTSRSAYLHGHGPQVGAEEEEPHQLIGLYGDQVVDLPQRHLAHGHVGGGQAQDLVVNHRLVNDTDTGRQINTSVVIRQMCAFIF